jgi:hypothetical protein
MTKIKNNILDTYKTMKITKTLYYQFGSELTPDPDLVPNPTAPPTYFPAPSGEYNYTNRPIIDNTAHIPISVPFKVRTIHIKNINYTSGIAGNQGTVEIIDGVAVTCTPVCNFYINIISSLVGNRPVGMVHADSQYSMNTKQDIKHTFQIPIDINGIYDFNLYDNGGLQLSPFQSFETAPALPDPGKLLIFFDSFSITMEFNSEYEE